MKTLITGSLAFDSIMVFPDKFKNHILPEQTHILNVCFLVPQMRCEFGGCAGNIAYGLKLLGGEPVIMASAGKDFDSYSSRLKSLDIDIDNIKIIDDAYTAQAYITTDIDDNQIIAFHPGAMDYAHLNTIDKLDGLSLGILSPDGKQGMLDHAQQFAEQTIPFIFDPGQGLPMFDGEQLREFIRIASYVIVNDYESKMLEDKTGKAVTELATEVEAFIVTKGAKGSQIYTNDECINIDSVTVSNPLDPTGCGDAYRSGILFGLANGLDWSTTGRIASLMGAIKIQSQGPQNYTFTMEEFNKQYEKHYSQALIING